MDEQTTPPPEQQPPPPPEQQPPPRPEQQPPPPREPTDEYQPPPPPEPTAEKADLGTRFVAGIIDAVIGVVVGFLPVIGWLVAAAYWLVRDGLEFDFMDHRSIGKKLMKLRPVTLDGSPMDITISAKRNWMFALGGVVQLLLFVPVIGWALMIPLGLIALVLVVIEIILVVTDPKGRRLGDKFANTQVISVGS